MNGPKYHASHETVFQKPGYGSAERQNIDKKESAEEKTGASKDQNPLKWFGVLTPPALKQAQV